VVVTEPPRPAPIDDQETLEALDALIEEARRRARRRRRRVGAASLLTVILAAAGASLLRDGGASGVPSGSRAPAVPVGVVPDGVVEAGELAITDYDDYPSDPGIYGGRRGWYGLSTIDRSRRLQPLVRCPAGRDWCGWVVSADWSPDGRYLALSVITMRTPNPNGIHIIDMETGLDRHLGKALTGRDLEWSPDGLRLAFSDRGVIKVLDLQIGGSPRVITNGASPSWSPDGQWLAFASDRVVSGSARVYVVRADGTAKRLLKRRAAAPAWSPTDDVIAYRSDCGINLMTSRGRDVTPPSPSVCQAIGVRGTPAWSPDGKRIAIGAGHISPDRPYGTFVMNADGSNLVRVSTRARGNAGFGQPRPTWRPRR
jgi:hypothetical protein